MPLVKGRRGLETQSNRSGAFKRQSPKDKKCVANKIETLFGRCTSRAIHELAFKEYIAEIGINITTSPQQ